MITSTFPMTATLRSRSLTVAPCVHAYPQAPTMSGIAASADAAVAFVAVKTTVGSDNQGRPPRGVPR